MKIKANKTGGLIYSWSKQFELYFLVAVLKYCYLAVSNLNFPPGAQDTSTCPSQVAADPLKTPAMTTLWLLLAAVSLAGWPSPSHSIDLPYVVDVDDIACESVASANQCELKVADSPLVAKITAQGCGYFDHNEGPLNNRWFAECDPVFTSGYAKVCVLSQDNRLGCGLIDGTGEVVIPLVYDQLRLVERVPVVAVNYQNNWGFYSLAEKRLLFAPQFSDVSDFGDGLAYVIDADNQLAEPAWIIDDRGLRVAPVDQSINVAGHFANGLIPAEIDFRWGYLDSNGNWAIAPQFFAAEPFIGGLATVQYASVPEQWAIIDTGGAGLVFFEGLAHRLTLTEDLKADLKIRCIAEDSALMSMDNDFQQSSERMGDANRFCHAICFNPLEETLTPNCS